MATTTEKREVLKGKEMLVYVDGELVAAQTDCSENDTADTLETTSKDTNGHKTFDAGLIEGEITMDALVMKGQLGYGLAVLTEKFRTNSQVLVKIVEPGVYVKSGYAVITSLSKTGNMSEASKVSMTVKWSSAPVTSWAPYIKSASFSTTTVTVKLTQKVAINGSAVLKDSITVEDGTVSSASIGVSPNDDTITITTAQATTAGKKVFIDGGTLKSGEAVQVGQLYHDIAAAA